MSEAKTGEQQRERRRKLRRFAQLVHQIGGVELKLEWNQERALKEGEVA